MAGITAGTIRSIIGTIRIAMDGVGIGIIRTIGVGDIHIIIITTIHTIRTTIRTTIRIARHIVRHITTLLTQGRVV